MTRQELQDRIHYILVAAIAFTMPFSIKLNSLLILVCALNWFLEENLPQRISRSLSSSFNISLILLFLICILSALFSINQHEGWAIVERRLSLLAFPLILYRPVTDNQLRWVCMSFVTGVCLALIYCLISAFIKYLNQSDSNFFFYHTFTSAIHMHAVYLAAYVVLCIHIMLFYMNRKSRLQRLLLYSSMFILLPGLLLLSSKMLSGILLVGIGFWLFYFSGIKRRKRIVVFILFSVFFISSLYMIPQTRNRFEFEINSDLGILKKDSFRYDTPFTGTSLRLEIWKLCLSIQQEKKAWFTGVGTGDFQDLLNKKYSSLGMYMGTPATSDTGFKGYGPHSEYLEMLFELGLPGLALFLYILLVMVVKAFRSNDYLFLQLMLILCLFFVTESVLSTNKGIIFSLFFGVLFYARNSFEYQMSPGPAPDPEK